MTTEISKTEIQAHFEQNLFKILQKNPSAQEMMFPKIQIFETLDSTQTKLDELMKAGAAEGTLVIAENQTQGRGRLDRIWESVAKKNLTFSLLLRPANQIQPLLKLS